MQTSPRLSDGQVRWRGVIPLSAFDAK